jgi:hypothetical protein
LLAAVLAAGGAPRVALHGATWLGVWARPASPVLPPEGSRACSNSVSWRAREEDSGERACWTERGDDVRCAASPKLPRRWSAVATVSKKTKEMKQRCYGVCQERAKFVCVLYWKPCDPCERVSLVLTGVGARPKPTFTEPNSQLTPTTLPMLSRNRTGDEREAGSGHAARAPAAWARAW